VIAEVAGDWLDQLHGEVLVAAHVAILPRDMPAPTPDDLALHFIGDGVSGSLVSDGAAAAFADYRIHADGFSRLLIHDRGLGERRAGRLVQRLLEIEAYRMMALLALPLARQIVPEIARGRSALAEVTALMSKSDGPAAERALLDRLVQLAASIEGLSATTSYRFHAARAYHALVERRIQDLREQRIAGLQTMAEFMERRLLPAMRTCSSVADRLERLSQHIARASELLRTRVDITLEEQNRGVLRSMNRRARLQLVLNEMVEGLSIVAATYYLVGLVGYIVHAVRPSRIGIEDNVVLAVAAPIIFGSVWLLLRHWRRRLRAPTD